jgi:hypothetical protein
MFLTPGEPSRQASIGFDTDIATRFIVATAGADFLT